MIDNSEIQIMQIAQMLGIKFEHPLAEISPLDDQIKLGKRQKELVKDLCDQYTIHAICSTAGLVEYAKAASERIEEINKELDLHD